MESTWYGASFMIAKLKRNADSIRPEVCLSGRILVIFLPQFCRILPLGPSYLASYHFVTDSQWKTSLDATPWPCSAVPATATMTTMHNLWREAWLGAWPEVLLAAVGET